MSKITVEQISQEILAKTFKQCNFNSNDVVMSLAKQLAIEVMNNHKTTDEQADYKDKVSD